MWGRVGNRERAGLAKLQCKVSKKLNAVLDRARIVYESKDLALRTLVDLALNDTETFTDFEHFGAGAEKSCTLQLTAEEFKNTLNYRLKYNLITKTAFFAAILQHGAVLYAAREAAEA